MKMEVIMVFVKYGMKMDKLKKSLYLKTGKEMVYVNYGIKMDKLKLKQCLKMG